MENHGNHMFWRCLRHRIPSPRCADFKQYCWTSGRLQAHVSLVSIVLCQLYQLQPIPAIQHLLTNTNRANTWTMQSLAGSLWHRKPWKPHLKQFCQANIHKTIQNVLNGVKVFCLNLQGATTAGSRNTHSKNSSYCKTPSRPECKTQALDRINWMPSEEGSQR